VLAEKVEVPARWAGLPLVPEMREGGAVGRRYTRRRSGQASRGMVGQVRSAPTIEEPPGRRSGREPALKAGLAGGFLSGRPRGKTGGGWRGWRSNQPTPRGCARASAHAHSRSGLGPGEPAPTCLPGGRLRGDPICGARVSGDAAGGVRVAVTEGENSLRGERPFVFFSARRARPVVRRYGLLIPDGQSCCRRLTFRGRSRGLGCVPTLGARRSFRASRFMLQPGGAGGLPASQSPHSQDSGPVVEARCRTRAGPGYVAEILRWHVPPFVHLRRPSRCSGCRCPQLHRAQRPQAAKAGARLRHAARRGFEGFGAA